MFSIFCDSEKKWTFNNLEKYILNNLPYEYKYLARDKNGVLYVYTKKPTKNRMFHIGTWSCYDEDSKHMTLVMYDDWFKSIKWEDDEACRFRKFI